MSKRTIVFHPLLIPIFPTCLAYSSNLSEVDLAILFRPGLYILLGAVAVWGLASLLFRDWEKGGVFTSLSALLIFSYGHVCRWIARISWIGPGLAGQIPLTVVWLAALVILGIIIFRSKGPGMVLTGPMNLFAIFLMAYPVGHTLYYSSAIRGIRISPPEIEARVDSAGGKIKPDIIYVVLDGFGRKDILKRMYDHDNAWFLDSLKSMGFAVASNARSNYGQTLLSIVSCLNFSYLESVMDSSHIRASDRRPLTPLLQRNAVVNFCRKQGYKFSCVASGYSETEMSKVDTYLGPTWNLNEFEQFIISLTPLWTVLDLFVPQWQYRLNRERIDYAFRTLATLRREKFPRFVFAHIVAPHPPFVFGKDGELVRDVEPLAIDDGNTYIQHCSKADYIRRYREQIQYLEKSTLAMVSGLLKNNPFPPIIILQGDHGPGSTLNWGKPEKTDLHERLSILYALYLPGANPDMIPSTVTPVNTFRIIFNQYFHTALPLLGNRSGFSSWKRPYTYFMLPPED